MSSSVVFNDPDLGTPVTVSLPIEIDLDIETLKEELKIPKYVAVDNFTMRKTIAILWVASNLDKVGKEIGNDAGDKPIRTTVFGGIAFRLMCPSVNDPSNPLFRKPKDVDFAVLKEDGRRFSAMLQKMATKYGNGLFHWTFHRDRVFNSLRDGTRYRLRCVAETSENGTPIPGVTDVLCDSLNFCHEIPIRDGIVGSASNIYTVGLERLILTKTQLIKRVPRDRIAEEAKPRYLGDLGKSDGLLGIEPKDMRDVTAVFLDHDLGDQPGQINVDTLGTILRKNWGLRKTVLLNLTNLARVLSTGLLGLDRANSELAQTKVQRVIDIMNEKYVAKPPRFSLASEWWEAVDDGRT